MDDGGAIILSVAKYYGPDGKSLQDNGVLPENVRAQVPVVVALNGFQDAVREQQRVLMSTGIPVQLWDRTILVDRAQRLTDTYPVPSAGMKSATTRRMPSVR